MTPIRVFKLKPRTPELIASRDAVVACLEARELVNQAVKDHGDASDAAQAAGTAYKASCEPTTHR